MAKKSITDGETGKINQESITLLETLSEPFCSYCVQAMPLLRSKCRAIKIREWTLTSGLTGDPFRF